MTGFEPAMNRQVAGWRSLCDIELDCRFDIHRAATGVPMWAISRRALVISLGGALAQFLALRASAEDLKADYRALNLFGDIFERVRSHYVERVADRKLIDAAVDGMLKTPNIDYDSNSLRGLRDKYSTAATDEDTYRSLKYFGDVFEKLLNNNAGKIESVRLTRAAIDGMMSALDQRSGYIDPQSFRDMQVVQPRGEFGGVGLEITVNAERVKVISLIEGTPADRAGVTCGDIIVALDGAPLAGLTLHQVLEKLRGPVNSTVTLTILGEGRPRPFDLTLTREIIRVRSVRHRIEEPDIGYIRVTQFNEVTTENLKKALADISRQIPAHKLSGYAIDLRNNPGGLLDQVITIADAFLRQGEILFTSGRDPEDTQSFIANSGDLTNGKPIVVLINGETAAGAEMVAAALQDHRRATIVGTRSFGNGTVQTIIPLGAGNGALRLTTARLYTPAGRSIEGNGINPDFFVEQPAGDAADKTRASCAPAIPENKSEDAQLRYGLNFLRQNQK